MDGWELWTQDAVQGALDQCGRMEHRVLAGGAESNSDDILSHPSLSYKAAASSPRTPQADCLLLSLFPSLCRSFFIARSVRTLCTMHSTFSSLFISLSLVSCVLGSALDWHNNHPKRQDNGPSSGQAPQLETCYEDDYYTAFSQNPTGASSLCSSLLCISPYTTYTTDATARRSVRQINVFFRIVDSCTLAPLQHLPR